MKSITLEDCYNLVDSWFRDFACEWCGIGMPFYDIYLADFSCHAMDEEVEKRIIEEIGKRHKLDMLSFDGSTPLIMLATYVLFMEDSK